MDNRLVCSIAEYTYVFLWSLLKRNVRPLVPDIISGGGSGLVLEQREHCSPAVPSRERVCLRNGGDDFWVDHLKLNLGGASVAAGENSQNDTSARDVWKTAGAPQLGLNRCSARATVGRLLAIFHRFRPSP